MRLIGLLFWSRLVNCVHTGQKSTTLFRREIKRWGSLYGPKLLQKLTLPSHTVNWLRCRAIKSSQVIWEAFWWFHQASSSKFCFRSPLCARVWHSVFMLLQAEQESDVAREIFETMDQQLRDELPQILSLRIPYLDPSFECMVRCSKAVHEPEAHFHLLLQIRMQSHFASDGYDKLGGVQRYFAEGVRDDFASGGLDAQVRRPYSTSILCSICWFSYFDLGRRLSAGNEGVVDCGIDGLRVLGTVTVCYWCGILFSYAVSRCNCVSLYSIKFREVS